MVEACSVPAAHAGNRYDYVLCHARTNPEKVIGGEVNGPARLARYIGPYYLANAPREARLARTARY